MRRIGCRIDSLKSSVVTVTRAVVTALRRRPVSAFSFFLLCALAALLCTGSAPFSAGIGFEVGGGAKQESELIELWCGGGAVVRGDGIY
jgi:hypothetical protein